MEKFRNGLKQLGGALDTEPSGGMIAAAALVGSLVDDSSSGSSSLVAAACGSSSSGSSSPMGAAHNDSISGGHMAAAHGSSSSFGPFIQSGAGRPFLAAAGGSGASGSSSSPYKHALATEAVDLIIAEQMQVSGDICGSAAEITVDPGCGHSVLRLSEAQRLVPYLSKPSSPCELLELSEAIRVGLFAGPVNVAAQYVLRNVPVGLGPGVYPTHFLVMEDANFNITLGLDFLYAYAARLIPRSINNRQAGKFLSIPVPAQYARPGYQPPPPPKYVPEYQRASWVPSSAIPARYTVHRHRCHGRRLPMGALLSAAC
jgi:hypothetical protein